MRKLLIGLLILGGVIAAVAVIRRRSGSGVDEWDSFAADDVYAQASLTTAKATDAAKGASAKAADAAKEAATTATKAAKDAATKATDAAKNAATKATDAAKDA
jgi:colicin import membrane protein